MGKLATKPFRTSEHVPTKESELRWVFIDQPGKPNLQDKMCLNATLVLKTASKGCEALKTAIEDFWDENKPSGAKKAKSFGWRDEVDDDEKPTGETSFSFWTSATWPDGKPHIIDIYNAKGSKIALGGKKIGNGSFGAISGVMGIYDQGVAARGVTLYLNAIQLTQFLEFSQDAGFGEEEGDFDGVATEFDGTSEEEPEGEAKPRL